MPYGADTPLVVDLDGTLIKGDMLHETFWSALSRDWRIPFVALRALGHGRAALKRRLAEAAEFNAATLPYDQEALRRIRDWRADGGRVALVTASDQRVADAIAEHLGLFDETHGSDGARNLKGEVKAAFLVEAFGEGGFAYMGDTKADLAVWAKAGKAITVNAPSALRREAEAVCADVEHLGATTRSAKPYLKAMRPHQWLKNILVFLPIMAAQQLDPASILTSLLAFVAFSLVASSVYVVNDLLDLAADRAHPRKRNRPFAAGTAPIAHGTAMAGGLLALGVAVALLVGWSFVLVLAAYYAITTAYSLHLKRLPVIDICALAALYTIRIVAGAVAANVYLSVWLLAFAIFIFLSLAAVKRQVELVDGAERGQEKASGRGYMTGDLPIIAMIAIGAGYVSVLVLALYVASDDVWDTYAQPEALWGVCAVMLYWVTRTVMAAHRGKVHDDPVVFAVKDRISQVCFAIIGAFILWGIVAPGQTVDPFSRIGF